MTVDRNTGEIVETLSDVERSRLTIKEREIERGAQAVGESLRVIRNERLYRETHSTFDAYCHDRWGFTPRHANRQIAAVEVVATLGPTGPIPEAQTRELAPLLPEPEKMREVWQAANEATDGKPTAAAIRAAREPEPRPAPAPQVDTTARQERQLVDFIEGDASIQDLRYMQALLKSLSGPSGVHQFDPERVARIAEDIDITVIDNAFETFAKWREQVHNNRRSGLRIVKGDTQ